MADVISGDVGTEAKLYRNTGTHASPVWAECEHVRDLNMPDAWAQGDMSSRASRINMARKTRRTISVDFTMIHDLLDVDYVAFRAAHWDKDAVIDVIVINGPMGTAGNKGLRAGVQVFGHNWNQPLQEGQEVSISLFPTRYYDGSTLVVPVEYIAS